jgi:hypothetical protein
MEYLIMSSMHKIATIQLNSKRAPSHALIMRMAGVYLAAGHKAIDLSWRDQSIELTYHDTRGQWYGLGSINQESGSRIARELNEIRAFVLDHFQIVTIGVKNA